MQFRPQLKAKHISPKSLMIFAAGSMQCCASLFNAHKAILTAIVISSLLSSCVTISPATVELSSQVGDRITAMEQMHQLAIQRYFDAEEQKVKDFMTDEWEPLFLKNFLAESNVLNELNSVSRIDLATQKAIEQSLKLYLADTTEAPIISKKLFSILDNSRSNEAAQIERVLGDYIEDNKLRDAANHVYSLLGTDEAAKIMIEFAEAAHEVMLARRISLMEPIQLAREEATGAISAEYANIIRGQSIITGRLEAVRRNRELQMALLNSVVSSDIVKSFTDRATTLSKVVKTAINAAREAELLKSPGNN